MEYDGIDQTTCTPDRNIPVLCLLAYIDADEGCRMDDFANASFQPELVTLMDTALANAVGKLPHPVSSAHVQAIAQTILRSAKEGERNIFALETMALLELQIGSRGA
jgi:hypothetical protein